MSENICNIYIFLKCILFYIVILLFAVYFSVLVITCIIFSGIQVDR